MKTEPLLDAFGEPYGKNTEPHLKVTAFEKSEFQRWLKGYKWRYGITIEPSPGAPWKADEIEQRLRTIEFQLNKRYLRNSFPRWSLQDRFWCVAFREGDGIQNQKHWHILMYQPDCLYKKEQLANPPADLQLMWQCLPSRISTHKTRLIEPLHIDCLDDPQAAAVYASKWVKRVENMEAWFFATPPKIRREKSLAA